MQAPLQAAPKFSGTSTPLNLTRGSFQVWMYPPDPSAKAAGLIVFGSGDGGWTKWEERLCHSLSQKGFYVAGIDSKRYADQSYDWKTLSMDYQSIARALESVSATKNLPLFYGGFSTGAEQSTAAAAFNPRPDSLKYLLLIAPGKRGRYGMTISDLMGITPKGPDTFALSDHAPKLSGLRIAQFHGEHDPLDSTDWLKDLKVPHKLFITPGGWHMYHGADDAFLQQVHDSIVWLTSTDVTSVSQP